MPAVAQSYTELNSFPTNFRDAYPVQDVGEQGPGVQIDPAVESVMVGVVHVFRPRR
jgi:hypothetical protein